MAEEIAVDDAARSEYFQSGRLGKLPPSRTSILIEKTRFPNGEPEHPDPDYRKLFDAANEEAQSNPRYADVIRRLEDALDAHERLLIAAENAIASDKNSVDSNAIHEHRAAIAKLRRHVSDNSSAPALQEFIGLLSDQRDQLALSVSADHSALRRITASLGTSDSVRQERLRTLVEATKRDISQENIENGQPPSLIDLTPNQEAVYQALSAEFKRVPKIAKESNVPESEVRRQLPNLVRLKLADHKHGIGYRRLG